MDSRTRKVFNRRWRGRSHKKGGVRIASFRYLYPSKEEEMPYTEQNELLEPRIENVLDCLKVLEIAMNARIANPDYKVEHREELANFCAEFVNLRMRLVQLQSETR